MARIQIKPIQDSLSVHIIQAFSPTMIRIWFQRSEMDRTDTSDASAIQIASLRFHRCNMRGSFYESFAYIDPYPFIDTFALKDSSSARTQVVHRVKSWSLHDLQRFLTFLRIC